MGRNIPSSIDRALAVLEAFDGPEPELSLGDVARLTRLAKPSAHRFLQALRRTRCVVQDQRSRRYRIGPRVFELGMVFQRQLDVHRQALPHMHRLRDACGETVVLSTLDSGAVVIVDQVISRLELKLMQELGRRYPVTAGATGRVLLAFLPADEQERIVRAEVGARAGRERQHLSELLAGVQQDGMAVSASERVPGALSLSGPLWAHGEAPVAALSLTGPVSRSTPDSFARMVPELKRTLDDVSTDLGGGPRSRRYPARAYQRGGEAHARLASAFREITGTRTSRERSPR
jgi:DNA-binding IclR family transcriptional regulator